MFAPATAKPARSAAVATRVAVADVKKSIVVEVAVSRT